VGSNSMRDPLPPRLEALGRRHPSGGRAVRGESADSGPEAGTALQPNGRLRVVVVDPIRSFTPTQPEDRYGTAIGPTSQNSTKVPRGRSLATVAEPAGQPLRLTRAHVRVPSLEPTRVKSGPGNTESRPGPGTRARRSRLPQRTPARQVGQKKTGPDLDSPPGHVPATLRPVKLSEGRRGRARGGLGRALPPPRSPLAAGPGGPTGRPRARPDQPGEPVQASPASGLSVPWDRPAGPGAGTRQSDERESGTRTKAGAPTLRDALSGGLFN
jgi:hypothetical protein